MKPLISFNDVAKRMPVLQLRFGSSSAMCSSIFFQVCQYISPSLDSNMISSCMRT